MTSGWIQQGEPPAPDPSSPNALVPWVPAVGNAACAEDGEGLATPDGDSKSTTRRTTTPTQSSEVEFAENFRSETREEGPWAACTTGMGVL